MFESLQKAYAHQSGEANKRAGADVTGLIVKFTKRVSGQPREELSTIWERVYSDNKKPLPYNGTISVEKIAKCPGKVEHETNDNGDIVKFRILTPIKGVYNAKEETYIIDKKTQLVVRDVLVAMWEQVHNGNDEDVDSRNRDIIDWFVESDRPEVKKDVWHSISVGSNQSVLFAPYEAEEWAKFSAKDPQDNNYKMREDAILRMTRANPQFKLRLYIPKDYEGEPPCVENHYKGVLFARPEFVFSPFEYTVYVPTRPRYKVLSESNNLNKHVFGPIQDFFKDPFGMPRQVLFKIGNYGNLSGYRELGPEDDAYDETKTVNRLMYVDGDRRKFLYESNDGSTVQRKYTFSGVDHYTDSDERYQWEMCFGASEWRPKNPMDALGILDPYIYCDLLTACQPLPAFVEGYIAKPDTQLKYPFNQEPEEDDETKIKGYYKIWGNKLIPHWEEIRDMYMYPITHEDYFALMKESSSMVTDKKDRIFKKVTDEGEEVKYLILKDNMVNPLHNRGDESHVINLGSVHVAAYGSDDLDNLLHDRDLFVWTLPDSEGPLAEKSHQIFAFKKDHVDEEPVTVGVKRERE